MISETAKSVKLSVVICTYNRSALLRNCLESLAEQTVPQENFEVIVVDNNSTDDTQEAAGDFSEQFSHFQVLCEERQGLSSARNCGWQNAIGDYVGYVDDDAKISNDWVGVVLSTIKDHNPDVLGGPIFPYYTDPKPEWFKDEYEIRIQQRKSGWMKRGFISGSNLIVKKAVINELGGFDVEFGMKGEKVAFGEDTAFVKLARVLGKRIFYNLDLTVKHHVPAIKMDILFALNAAYIWGKSTRGMWDSPSPEPLVDLPIELDVFYKKLEDALNGKFNKKKFPFKENYIFEKCCPLLTHIGALVGESEKTEESHRGIRKRIKSWLKRKWRWFRQ